ncbi:hypothetical protein D3C76_1811440 [compost metagenome]
MAKFGFSGYGAFKAVLKLGLNFADITACFQAAAGFHAADVQFDASRIRFHC